MSRVTCRFLPLVLSAILVVFLCVPAAGDIAYIINKPSGDRNVSISFTYDPQAESEILEAIGEEGHVLMWQIQCADKYVFYRPFEFAQGRITIRPVLCLMKKYFCQACGEGDGFVFQGYLFLDTKFDLKSPINVTLADKTIRATFVQ
ncbi:MAG: hypothetical protein P1S46_05655 [bacterium]|nr:hypothetical protein [bacterium]